MREGMMDMPNWRFAAAGGRGRGRRGRPSPEEIERIMELRQMRGGPFGGGRGRRRRGDVRTAVLLLLAEEPRNGYQLMQEIEERSGGDWRPSPGSVYPTLSQLEDESLIRATEVDGAKAFEITDTGRATLEERGDTPAPWEHDDEGLSPRELRHHIRGIAAAAMQVAYSGDEQQVGKAREVLDEARRRLYRLLAGDDE
jgi:DNA-binding PadR family transcriptional regulator